MNLFRWITPQFAAAIATLLLVLSPFVAWAASALESTSQAGEKVTLYQTACTHDGIKMEIIKRVPEEYRGAFQQAEYRDPSGKVYAGCWMILPERPIVYLIYEDGEQGMLPRQAFKPRVDA